MFRLMNWLSCAFELVGYHVACQLEYRSHKGCDLREKKFILCLFFFCALIENYSQLGSIERKSLFNIYFLFKIGNLNNQNLVIFL